VLDFAVFLILQGIDVFDVGSAKHLQSLRRLQIYILFAIAACFLLNSCSSIAFLEKKKKIEKSEYLLYKINVKGNKVIPKDKFTPLYQQKPNKKLPILGSRPYFYFYIIGETVYSEEQTRAQIAKTEKKYDKKIAKDSTNTKRRKTLLAKKEKKMEKLRTQLKEGNGFMRTFGEAPSIANAELIERSAQMMSQMLRAKGYYHNTVRTHFDTSGKKLKVAYMVEEGKPHTISSVKVSVSNATAFELISRNSSTSYLKINKQIDESDLTQERDRLDKLLKNNGFYDFEKQSITYSIDTTNLPYAADVELIIHADSNSSQFRRYKIGKIVCLINQNRTTRAHSDTTQFEGIEFVQLGKKYGTKTLFGKILFKRGDYYSVDKTLQTQSALANLDNFRMIDIRYSVKSIQDTTLTAVILLSSQKKYQLTDEWGLNVTQGLPGPQASVSILDRNILKGCENLDFSVRYGIEGVASATSQGGVYKSVEAASDMGITFPQFYIPTRIRFKFNRFFPKTRLNFAFNNIVRPEYSRRNYKLALTYTFLTSPRSRFILSIADLNIIQTPKQTEAFSEYLDALYAQGNTLKYSFQPSFVSDVNFSYIYNTNDFTKFVNATFFRVYLESGGMVLGMLENTLKNKGVISNNKLFGELSYYRYLKFNIDWRTYRKTSKFSQVVTRVNLGAVYPFINDAVPYEKYFFSGGSNGMRAWSPRRLGPGSKVPVINPDGSYSYKYEQPGEIVIEANLESRFKVIKFIEGAAFVDVGNVWRIGSSLDDEAPQNFNIHRFYKEIAIGSGLGVRFNFTFIVVRFDLGLKVYDPAHPTGEKWVVQNWSLGNIFSTNQYGLLNLGIGYPF
jgi:hypothetical protein